MEPEGGDDPPTGKAVRLNRLGEERFGRGDRRKEKQGGEEKDGGGPFHWNLNVSEGRLLEKSWRTPTRTCSQLTLITIKFQLFL